MISLDKIEQEIIELESMRDTSFAACNRLSVLYICRDELRSRMGGGASPAPASERVSDLSGSEFLEAVSGKDAASVLSVMDEHMEAVRILYPREYEAVVGRLRSLD